MTSLRQKTTAELLAVVVFHAAHGWVRNRYSEEGKELIRRGFEFVNEEVYDPEGKKVT